MRAVWFTTGICRCDCNGSCHINKVSQGPVIWYPNGNRSWGSNILQCISNTEILQPVSFRNNTCYTTGVTVYHELPQQWTEWCFDLSELVNVWKAKTNGFFSRPFLYLINSFNARRMFAWTSQSINSICRNTNQAPFIQEFGYSFQPTSFGGIIKWAWRSVSNTVLKTTWLFLEKKRNTKI